MQICILMLYKIVILTRITLGFMLLFLIFPVQAEVWGYLDDKEGTHFANEKLDERYELFFRSNDSGVGASENTWTAFPRPINVPKAPPKLLAYFEMSTSYKGVRHLMREASDTHRIDIELLQAMIATESGFDRQAVSPKGAVGLMQIMPTTAQRFGVVADASNPIEKKLTDPQVNIAAGTRILRHLLDRYTGQLELALAAYNAGEGAVQRAGNRIPNYSETQNYVKTVMQLYTLLKPPTVIADLRRQTTNALATPLLGGSGGAVLGGALGRSNMLIPLQTAQQVPLFGSYPTVHD
jgi:Transglycosylase SLT domain